MGTELSPSEDKHEPREALDHRTVMVAKASWVGPRKLMIDPDTIQVVTEGGDDDPRSY